ncbi:START-like domain-containing protein [Hymenobacter psoromatis]|uniref:START-like domain-containing protein n=1 Tax=Hymenobacter psoromatis TaxID=1484116 RepID=UPI001CC1BED5|nr:START-like domain-containing protein [Hymenobacter psoromatis]
MAMPATGAKHRFEMEYAINASLKILFPYIASASGLAQWFCDDVRLDPDHRLDMVWDKQSHYAEIATQRPGRSIRYVFLDENKRPLSDASYLDFTLESSRITDEVFLRVTDYSEHLDEQERLELWEGLVGKLREQVGG